MCHSLTIHQLKAIWLISSFELLQIKLLWTFMYKFLRENKSSFLLAKCPGMWLLSCMISVCVFSPQKLTNFSRVIISFYVPQKYISNPVSSHPCQHLVLISVFHSSHFDKHVVILHCGLICISLMANDADYLFMCLCLPPIYFLWWNVCACLLPIF